MVLGRYVTSHKIRFNIAFKRVYFYVGPKCQTAENFVGTQAPTLLRLDLHRGLSQRHVCFLGSKGRFKARLV
eukprot:6018461-Pleurochrysis_carterae.AAC.1